jgi:hypothetical protein
VPSYCFWRQPELACGLDDGTLFLSTLGEAFAPNRQTQMVRDTTHTNKLVLVRQLTAVHTATQPTSTPAPSSPQLRAA